MDNTDLSDEEYASKLADMYQLANKYRGSFIGAFTRLEHILADINIRVTKTTFSEYYKSFKTSSAIISDFKTAYPKITHLVKFGNEELFFSDLSLLERHRNILAHWLLVESADQVQKFDQDHVLLHSWKFGEPLTETYNHYTIHCISRLLQNLTLILIDLQSILLSKKSLL